MKSLGRVLYLVIFFATNKADTVDEFNGADIEDMYVLKDGPSVSALLFLKENEDTTTNSNEEDNTEIILPEDVTSYEIVNEDALEELLNSSSEGIFDTRGVLRRRPWKGCLKKGSKVCAKACKRAYKNACAYRECSKKLKKTLKKECKRECKGFFVGD